MMKVQLIVVQGKPEGKVIPVPGPVFSIGREEACHLRPTSEEISRRHAEIVVAEGIATIRDLRSRNGTLLNGKPLDETPVVLKNGDLVGIAAMTFAVSIQGAPATAAASTVKPPSGAALDEVGQDKIDSWLIADATHNVPDRPSGVYDGDTLTLNAFKEGGSGSVKAVKAKAAPTAAKPAQPAAAPAAPQPPAFLKDLENHDFEHLPEGAGDGEVHHDAEAEATGGEENGDDAASEEWVDETNPFHAAKKGSATEEAAAASKASYTDTSDAANDILRKMLDRRKATKP